METTPDDKRGRGRPATGQTPKRYFRMSDEDWQQVVDAAAALDETASEYARRVLLKNAAGVLKKNG
jgi:hypothetical protein